MFLKQPGATNQVVVSLRIKVLPRKPAAEQTVLRSQFPYSFARGRCKFHGIACYGISDYIDSRLNVELLHIG